MIKHLWRAMDHFIHTILQGKCGSKSPQFEFWCEESRGHKGDHEFLMWRWNNRGVWQQRGFK